MKIKKKKKHRKNGERINTSSDEILKCNEGRGLSGLKHGN